MHKEKSPLLETLIYKHFLEFSDTTAAKTLAKELGIVLNNSKEATWITALLHANHPVGIELLLQTTDHTLIRKWIPHFLKTDLNIADTLIAKVYEHITSRDMAVFGSYLLEIETIERNPEQAVKVLEQLAKMTVDLQLKKFIPAILTHFESIIS